MHHSYAPASGLVVARGVLLTLYSSFLLLFLREKEKGMEGRGVATEAIDSGISHWDEHSSHGGIVSGGVFLIILDRINVR